MLKCCSPDRMQQLRKTFFPRNCWNPTANVLVIGSCSFKVGRAFALHGCSCNNFEPFVQTLLSKQSSAELRNFLWHLPADSYLKFSSTKNIRCAALHLSRGRLLHSCRAEMHLRATNPMIRRASLVLSKAKISLPFFKTVPENLHGRESGTVFCPYILI